MEENKILKIKCYKTNIMFWKEYEILTEENHCEDLSEFSGEINFDGYKKLYNRQEFIEEELNFPWLTDDEKEEITDNIENQFNDDFFITEEEI